MSAEESLRHYLLATNELLLELAREAKRQADSTRGTAAGSFNEGYLMGFHRVVSLMQQQAPAFGLAVSEVGLEGVNPNQDLT